MKVLVTGASGFIGAHTTAALTAAGHQVRAFVRSPAKLERALAPLRTEAAEVAVGDILDAGTVRQAAAGCQAAVNCANIYTFSTNNRKEMHRVNLAGTENALSATVDVGCDPVIHVSSLVALLPSPGTIAADPPIGRRSGHDYPDSKIAAEEVARRFQDDGAPVITVYPGQVYGPNDPGPGEMLSLTRLFLGPVTLGLRGRIGIVDVRWLARLYARLLEPGTSARRILAPGRTLQWANFGRELRAAAGLPPPRYLPTPYPVARFVGWTGQAIARATGWYVPVNGGGPWVIANWQPGDDSLARQLAGPLPPLAETLTDSIRSMTAAGQLTLTGATAQAAR